jgi:hypothetical protein
VGNGVIFSLGVKRRGREIDNSRLSMTEDKNEWSYTFTVPVCLHGVHSQNYTFLALILLKQWGQDLASSGHVFDMPSPFQSFVILCVLTEASDYCNSSLDLLNRGTHTATNISFAIERGLTSPKLK